MAKKAAKTKKTRVVQTLLRKASVSDAVGEIISEIECLAEEMGSWRDNMEEKLSHTSKYESVSECADTLENISSPDVAESLNDVEVMIHDLKPRRRGYSRAARLAQAMYVLDQCVSALEEFEASETASEDAKSDAESLRDELENIRSDCDGVDFPGMFG